MAIAGRALGLAGLLAVCLARSAAAADGAPPPAVAVSIKPLHALAAAVMDGVAEPQLLVPGSASEHSYVLRPSQVRRLVGARLIIWIGPALETYLVKPIAAAGTHAAVLQASAVPGLLLLANREGGAWESDDDHPHGGQAAPGGADLSEIDPHLWLDPQNAEILVDAIAAALTRIDPARAKVYAANAAREHQRLLLLDQDLQARLGAVRGIPYIVFHDAYQYLERRYHLAAVGSVTISPDRSPGASRLLELRRKMATARARCAFREPQFPPALLQTVIADSDVRVGVLDPLGAELPAGPDAYEVLLRNLAASLVKCLAPNS